MGVYEILFIVSLFAGVMITLYKLWNALNGFALYDWRESSLFFVAYLISWGIMFVTFMTNPEVTTLRHVYMLANTLFALNVVFWLVESILNGVRALNAHERGRYAPDFG